MPNADPYLLPMAGLLTAIGLTEIYRLGPTDAFKQGLWIVIGVALFAVALIGLRRDYRVLESYKYLFGIGAIVLLFLPRLPGLGTTVNGARLWVHVGSLQFQPGELAKIFLIVFLAAYLREKREVLAQGRLKDLGPLLADLGRRDARARRDERPRLGAPLLRDLPRDALHRDRAALVRRAPGSCSSSSAASAADSEDRARPRAHHDLAPSVDAGKVFCPLDRRRWRCARTARATSS